MQDIFAWLQNSQDFNVGAVLYKKYGQNSFFKKLLNDGPTQFNKVKLVAELTAILATAPPAKEKPFPKKDKDPVKENPEQKEPNIQDHIRKLELDEYAKKLYRQLDFNRAILTQTNKEVVLHETAKQILKIRKELIKVFVLINYYDENGYLPKQAVVKNYSHKEKIQLLRQSNSKAKKRLENPECKDREQTLKLIEENNKQIIALGGSVKC
jgi:hypothetical protein